MCLCECNILPKLQTGCLLRDKEEIIIVLQNYVRPQWTVLQGPMSVWRDDLIHIPMFLPLNPKHGIVAKSHMLQKPSPNTRQLQINCGLSKHGGLIHIQVLGKRNYSSQSGRNNCKCRWVDGSVQGTVLSSVNISSLNPHKSLRNRHRAYLLLMPVSIMSTAEVWGTEQSLPPATAERWRS